VIVEGIEDDLDGFANGESWASVGPNWGGVGSLGAGLHSAWAYTDWSICVSGPENF
jgi:hypothetical protein